MLGQNSFDVQGKFTAIQRARAAMLARRAPYMYPDYRSPAVKTTCPTPSYKLLST